MKPCCKNGHRRTPENIRLRPNGEVRCRICDRESNRRNWQKRRSLKAPKFHSTHTEGGPYCRVHGKAKLTDDPKKVNCRRCIDGGRK